MTWSHIPSRASYHFAFGVKQPLVLLATHLYATRKVGCSLGTPGLESWLDGLGVSQERFDVVLATQLVLMKVLFLGFEILLVDLVFSAGGACNRSNNGRAIRAKF